VGGGNLYGPWPEVRALAQILCVQIENIFYGQSASWALKGASIDLPTAFNNNLRYFWRYLKINSSENLCSMRVTARFVIPASAPIDSNAL